MTLVYARGIIKSHRYLLKNNKINKSAVRNSVILLVPIYQEAQIIDQTFNYFHQIVDKLNIKIIFITTEVEGSIYTNKTYLSVKKINRQE